MSEFFNPKEDVLDLELTQYGKYLLSKGEMKPHYYAFYDDDILYDSTFGGVTEPSYNSHERIKNLTPRTKTQSINSGIETEIRKINQLITSNLQELGSNQVQPIGDKAYSLPMPIGTSGVNTNKSPNWNIFFGKAMISSSMSYLTGTSGETQIINIPQVNINHKATSRVGYKADAGAVEAAQNLPDALQEKQELIDAATKSYNSNTLQDPGESAISEESPEGFFFYVEQDFVFLDVKEENCSNLNENFDIEVFEVTNEIDPMNGKRKETMKQLKFYPNFQDIGDLTDGENLSLQYPMLTSDYVEYYFDLDVDQEIKDYILCQVDFQNKKENIFTDTELEFECLPPVEGPSVYTANIVEQEEPCQ